MNLKKELLSLFSRDADHLTVTDEGYSHFRKAPVFEIRLGAEYTAPDLSVEHLEKLAELFGTNRINVDDYANPGCEPCDWGSDYGHTIQIIDPKENLVDLYALCEEEKMRPQEFGEED